MSLRAVVLLLLAGCRSVTPATDERLRDRPDAFLAGEVEGLSPRAVLDRR